MTRFYSEVDPSELMDALYGRIKEIDGEIKDSEPGSAWELILIQECEFLEDWLNELEEEQDEETLEEGS